MEHTDKQFNYDEATDSGGVIYRKADPKSIGVEYAPVMNKVGGNYNNPKQLDLYDHIGLHYLDTVTNVQADLILNKFCNNRIGSTHQIPHNTTCCFDYKNEGLAQSSGMVFLGALCTILAIIISLIVPPSRPSSSSTSGALGLFIQKLNLFETLFTTISVISIATVYSYLSDRTHHFYNENMIFSWYELFALCQCLLIAAAATVRRFSSYPSSSNSHPTSYMKLSVTFLHEWKGFVVCLVLISNITGLDKPLISDYTPGVIFSELMEISWLFAEVYEFTARCLEDTSSVSFAQYIVLNLRTALLPAILSWVLNTSYFFYPLAAKLQFWYLFIFLTFKVLDFNNVIPSSYSGQIPGTKSVYVQLFKVFFMAIGAMATISMILHPILSSQLFPVNLYRDFFILIIAIFWSTYQNAESSSTQSDQAKSEYTSSSRITCPSTLTVFLGVCAIGFFTNLCFLSFSFAEPEEYITEWHTLCSLAFIFGYVVLRSYIWHKTDGLYISLWTYISSFSFELFVLRYHIFLNGDFSTRLYLISTGTNSTYFIKAGFYLYENLHDIYNLVLVTLIFVFICKGIGFSWIKLITLLESTSDDMYSARGSRMPWILPEISFLSARSRNNNSSTHLASNSTPDINYAMENKTSTEFSQYDLESPISFNSMDGIKESDLTDGDESISHK